MDITRADPEFRPVTIVLETQDEFDQLVAVLATVAQNKVNHFPPTIRAAADILATLNRFESETD